MRPENTINKLQSSKAVTIAAIGDSLTYGWMVNMGYMDFFEQWLSEKYSKAAIKIINRGIPGDTASGGFYRLKGDVIKHFPDCVFIQFGLNDLFTGTSPAEYKSNVKAIIESLKSGTSADIVLITSVCLGDDRGNEMVNEVYGKLEELSSEFKLPIARVHRYWSKKISEGTRFYDLVQMDNVHPNEDGYRLMAEAVMELF